MTVAPSQRHTKQHRCPICGGADQDPRGVGKRCHGFTTTDGYAHCSRGDLAGAIEVNGAGLYAHRLHGECRCGQTHGAPDMGPTPMPNVGATYDYCNESRTLLYQVVRKVPKDFRQRRPDGRGSWIWNVEGVRLVPYKLPDLLADDGDRPVYVVEGEKDVDALWARGHVATCNPMGAGKWSKVEAEARKVLAGRDIIIVADNDVVGRQHARQVEASLRDVAASVRVVQCPTHHDVSDHFASGGTLDQLLPIRADGCDVESDAGKGRRVWMPADVMEGWRQEGTFVHEPTGLAGLDEVTGGGPVYGTRWYILGAPDAGKTALLIQIADVYARRGVVVGVHGIDEEPGDLVTRLAQRAGWSRRDCEARHGATLASMVLQLPQIRMYGPEWTIEAATEDLASAADGKHAAYLVDSIQGVTSEREGGATSPHQAVTARVAAVRQAATRHHLIAVATCEMNRGAYRSVEASEAAREAGDLASAKESGAIEYSARVMLALRSVKGNGDRIELSIGKNKHGPRGGLLYLHLDRERMVLTDAPAPPEPDPNERARERDRKARDRLVNVAAAVAQAIMKKPGIGKRDIRAAARATLSRCSDGDAEAALRVLGDAVQVKNGKRGALHHTIEDPSRLPEDVKVVMSPVAGGAT